MNTFKAVLLTLSVLTTLLISSQGWSAASGPERAVTVDPVVEDYGNHFRLIDARKSTNSFIIISSAPENSGLAGVTYWRFREIVNTSDGMLSLYPSYSTYTVITSTFGIVLSSSTNPLNIAAGDSWVVPGQGNVFGLWSSSTTKGGASGSEHWFKKD